MLKLLKKNGIQMLKRVVNRLTQIATLLTLLLVIYFFYTYNYRDDRKLQSSRNHQYENTR